MTVCASARSRGVVCSLSADCCSGAARSRVYPHRARLGVRHGDGRGAGMRQRDLQIRSARHADHGLLQQARQHTDVAAGNARREQTQSDLGRAPSGQRLTADWREAVGQQCSLLGTEHVSRRGFERRQRRGNQGKGARQRAAPFAEQEGCVPLESGKHRARDSVTSGERHSGRLRCLVAVAEQEIEGRHHEQREDRTDRHA